MPKLTKKEIELFHDCQGQCRICFYEGGCALQNKLTKEKRQNGL